MPKNIFLQDALAAKEKRAGEARKAFAILRLPSRLLLATSISVAIGTVIWSLFAKIPVQESGVGIVYDLNNATELKAPGSGRIVFTTKDFRTRNYQALQELFNIQQNPSTTIPIEDLIDLSLKALQLTDLKSYLRVESERSTDEALREIASGDSFYRIGEVIALIFSDNSRWQLITDLKKYSTTYAASEVQRRKSLDLQGVYSKVIDNQRSLLSIIRDLEKRRYVAKTDVLSQETQAAQLQSQLVQNNSTYEQSKASLLINQRSLQASLVNFISSSFVLSENNGWMSNAVVSQRSIVSQGSDIATLEKGNSTSPEYLPPRIIGFIDVNAVNKVMPGNRAILTPSGINKSEYGGMIGTIKTIIPYGDSSESLEKILGIDSIAQQSLSAIPNPTLVLIDMKFSKNNKSSYQWTTSAVPNRPTRRGDFLSMTISVDSKTPMQLVIPWLANFLGFDGPTNFTEAFKNKSKQ